MFRPEVVAAIVALLSAFISVSATVYANRLLAKVKSIEVQLQIRQEMSMKILEYRLQCYPTLFEKLSFFIKKDRYNEIITRTDMKALLEEIDVWDSKHAIFYTCETAYTLWKTRKLLKTVLEEEVINNSKVAEVVNEVVQSEIALRSDRVHPKYVMSINA